jgi:sigma-B regulation protein RsbU (phosphoserine phosphatase)
MRAVNDDFRSIFGARSFMTAMCVALDPDSGRGTIVGAGHPPLLVRRGNAEVEAIPSSAPPLGLMERSKFSEADVHLAPGDAFLLYTDGLLGNDHIDGSRLTPAKLAETLRPPAANMQALLARVIHEATTGDTTKSLPDDVAALAVQRRA